MLTSRSDEHSYCFDANSYSDCYGDCNERYILYWNSDR